VPAPTPAETEKPAPRKRRAAEPPAEAETTEESQRPSHERTKIVEGQVADIQRLKPTAIKPEERTKLNLWQKRALMIDELGTVPKRGWNAHHKYSFAMEADVVAYLGPLMTKYMVVVNVTVLLALVERIELSKTSSGATMTLTRLPVEITIINADNPEERESVVWIGEGSDTGDKGVYKSYTGALKYFYLKWFQIATGDDPEAFERTDALNESGGRRGVEALSGGGDTGRTEVRQAEGRRQPERGGRQTETTMVQIRTLGNLSSGMGLGPRGTAEEIDRVLGTQLAEMIDEIEGDDAQRAALVEFLKGRPGTDTGKVIHAVTELAERAAQIRSESELAAAQTDYAGGEEQSEEELLAQAREELDGGLDAAVEADADTQGVTDAEKDGSGS